MPLSDTAIRNAKPLPDKAFKIPDEKGMYLLVHQNGSKYFRLDYRFNGKRKTLALGVYPDTTLKDARTKRDQAREQIAKGNDPGLMRKIDKAGSAENSFSAVAREFIEANKNRWSPSHREHIEQCFERDVYPWLGDRPLKDLSAVEVLATLRRIVDRGALETAARTKQFIGQAVRYGIATGRAERDVTADLRGALPSPARGHFAAITEPKPLSQLLRDIDAYKGNFVVRTALQLQPLIFARPANLVAAEWSEFDLDAAEWRIAADKMKMKDAHIVPLSRQAVALLRDIYPLTGSGRYVFASNQGKTGGEPHINREAIGAALRRMGYQGQHTAHGFRTTASTLLHEQGFHSDMIERQLSHAERNRIKAAYNRAQHLPERRLMMQAWSDYLDSLKNGADIIPFKKSG
jgi:integrase